MSNKRCIKCGQIIVPILNEELCFNCINKRSYYSELYYDTLDISRKLGISERQVRRKAHNGELPGKVTGIKRHLFKKDIIDEWQKAGQPTPKIPKIPTTPLQEKAYAMCRKKDHSWMADKRYADNAYTREEQVDTGKYTITLGFIHKCWFCGYEEYHYF